MFTKVNTASLLGMECTPITVEVDIAGSWPGFHIVGLGDAAVQEAKERIRTAWKNADFEFPSNSKIVINLAPADVRKVGTGFDLPMAVGMYMATAGRSLPTENSLFVGELALDGSLRHTSGMLPTALYARETGIKELYIPAVNAKEVAIIDGITIYPVQSLAVAIEHLTGGKQIEALEHIPHIERTVVSTGFDMADIKGQQFAKRALEIAAAGGHNILLNGPPGSGKTLLARTFSSILPHMTQEEAIDVTKVYSIAGLLPVNTPLITRRPFRSPHHSASGVSLVGGGRFPKPGEISLSHRGVLFLDEFPEFPRPVLENLRQPLEDGIITISRVHGTCEFPADFILIASQNPCPCGFATDPEKQCICSPISIDRYSKKVSGPLLDRIDLHVEVPRVPFDKLSSKELAESSEDIQSRVQKARDKQDVRFIESTTVANSGMNNSELRTHCDVTEEALLLLKSAMQQFNLSARGYNRMLKVGRTIADIEGSKEIETQHIAEALQYRVK